ncbi:MAG TPA: response regulator transcription factor [Crenotrichaceae bacterium]|nr:response regulator transcription factor [Crenotrichaceae bacterium]
MSNQDKNTTKLILVDDDETFCSVLQQALAKRNYDVVSATNIADAVTAAKQHQPDAAVVDLRIGHESGLELVSQLIQINADIQIVMLTGYSSVATAVEAIKLGATYYLTKPADVDEIIAALAKIKGDSSVTISDRPVSVKRLEWEHLQKVLTEHNGNISAAARALNMHRRTLQRKLEKKPVRK